MAEAAGVAAGGEFPRRSVALSELLKVAGLAWPVVMVVMAGLAVVAVAGDHIRISRLDPAILPEGWTGANFRIALAGINFTPQAYAIAVDAAKASMLITYFTVAGIVWQRRRAEPGALFVAYFLIAFAANWEVEPARLPQAAGPLLGIVDNLAWTAFLNFFLLFPDNRYRPRWTVWLGVGIPVLALIAEAARMSAPILTGLWVTTLILAITFQVIRYRFHSGPTQRQQARWLLIGFGVTTGLMVATIGAGAIWHPDPPARSGLLLHLFGQAVGQVGFIPIPLAIAVAITRHHLWEMDRVVNRALVYGVLTGGLGLVYMGVAFIAGSRLSGEAGPLLSFLAAVVVAVLLQPARARVQLALNHAMYGRPNDPYSALSRLGQRLSANLAADEVLSLIAATVKEALRSPYVEIRVSGDDSLGASAGDRPAPGITTSVPIDHQGERVGELLVVPRAGKLQLGEADLRLLQDLAFPTGVAIHEFQLRRQLIASRESLVLAREEERRRLSRILHDDLGATLAAQKLKAGGAAAVLKSNPAAASKQLASLETDLGEAISRLRELAYELRPPALEDLGLLEALKELARNQQREGLQIELLAKEPVPLLPAAAELSVYRIVEQAVANTVRHADARRCVIELIVGTDIVIAVTDDGIGVAEGSRPGLGISSMRERAEELGGVFTIEELPGGGTRVTARIPAGARALDG